MTWDSMTWPKRLPVSTRDGPPNLYHLQLFCWCARRPPTRRRWSDASRMTSTWCGFPVSGGCVTRSQWFCSVLLRNFGMCTTPQINKSLKCLRKVSSRRVCRLSSSSQIWSTVVPQRCPTCWICQPIPSYQAIVMMGPFPMPWRATSDHAVVLIYSCYQRQNYHYIYEQSCYCDYYYFYLLYNHGYYNSYSTTVIVICVVTNS